MKCDDCGYFQKMEYVDEERIPRICFTLYCRSMNRDVSGIISCTQYIKIDLPFEDDGLGGKKPV